MKIVKEAINNTKNIISNLELGIRWFQICQITVSEIFMDSQIAQ